MNLLESAKKLANGASVIREWLGSGGVTTDIADAQRRADICIACPHNQPSRLPIGVIAGAVKRHLEVKNKLGLRVKGEKSLETCEICGCANRLKVWLPRDLLRAQASDKEISDFSGVSGNCWVKEELK